MLVAGLLLAGCAAEPEGPRVIVPGGPGEPGRVLSGQEAAERRSPVPVSPADVEFARSMVPHHQQAIELAALAPGRAADQRVLGLAARVAAVQGPEIDVLEAFLARQEDTHPHGPDHPMPGMATPAQLGELAAATGPAFDRLFLQLMTVHHEGALEMASVVRGAGTDIVIAELAQDIVVTQTAEIDRMRGLLAEV